MFNNSPYQINPALLNNSGMQYGSYTTNQQAPMGPQQQSFIGPQQQAPQQMGPQQPSRQDRRQARRDRRQARRDERQANGERSPLFNRFANAGIGAATGSMMPMPGSGAIGAVRGFMNSDTPQAPFGIGGGNQGAAPTAPAGNPAGGQSYGPVDSENIDYGNGNFGGGGAPFGGGNTGAGAEPGAMEGTPLSIPSPFGEQYQTYESLLSMRNQLSRLRSKSEAGEVLTPEDLSVLTGITQFSPDQMETIERAKADNFNAPISYIDSILDREARMAEQTASNTTSNPFGGGTTSDPIQMAAMTVLSQLPGTQQDAFAFQINSYIQNGQQDAAKELIKNRAIGLQPTNIQNDLISRAVLVKNLEEARNVLGELEERGIPTHFLRGSAEDIKRKFGRTGDPQLVEFGTRVQNALDLLSRSRTGAAMTPAEEAFYQNMFPDTTNNASLNYTLIDTMTDMMNEQDDITLGFVFDPYVSEQIGYGNGQGMQQQPYSPQQIQDAISQGVPQEFIDQMTGGSSFNQGSSISSLDEFTNSIAGVESGANYGALGPVINNNGMYQGQRAMGKYQIMPGNLASVSGNQNGWDIQAMGRPVSPAEFMNSPQIQETIARYQINQLYQQYGNWQDVASAWHSGRPLSEATAAGAQDANITTANYVENVMNYA